MAATIGVETEVPDTTPKAPFMVKTKLKPMAAMSGYPRPDVLKYVAGGNGNVDEFKAMYALTT
jgi:hypothetical protein